MDLRQAGTIPEYRPDDWALGGHGEEGGGEGGRKGGGYTDCRRRRSSLSL